MKKITNIFTILSAICCIAFIVYFFGWMIPEFTRVASLEENAGLGIAAIIFVPLGILSSLVCFAAAVSDFIIGIVGLCRKDSPHVAKVSAGLTALDLLAIIAIILPPIFMIEYIPFVLPYPLAIWIFIVAILRIVAAAKKPAS